LDRRGVIKTLVACAPLVVGGIALVLLAPRASFPPIPLTVLFAALAAVGGTRVYAFVQGGHQTLIAAVQLPAIILLGPVPAALSGAAGVAVLHWFRRTSLEGAVHSIGQRMVSTLVAGIAWSTMIEGHPVLHRPSVLGETTTPLLAVTGALLAYALTSAFLVGLRYASARHQPLRFVLSTNAVWDVTGTVFVGAFGLAVAIPFTRLSLRHELDSIIGVVLLSLTALLYIFRRQTIVEAAGLRDAVVDLLRTRDLDELLARLADRVAPIARPDALWIAQRRTDGQYAVVLARGIDAGTAERVCAQPGGGLGWTLGLRRTTCVDDYRKDARWSQEAGSAIGPGRLRSLLIAPLLAGDELLGALVLVKSVAAFFTPFQQQNVAALAAQAALTMKNVSLSHATAQQLQRMRALEAISEQINSQHDLTTLFSLIADSAREVLGADRCVVALGHEGGATPEIFARGLSDDYLDHLRVTAEDVRRNVTLARLAMRTREPVVVTDVLTDPRTVDIRDAAKREGIRTLAVFPLRYEERAIGTLRLYHDAVRPYEPPDVALGIAFANQAAIAVQNSRLLHEAQLRAHQLGLINRVVTRVAALLRPEELFETLVHELHGTLSYPFVMVVLADEDQLRVSAYRGYAQAPSLHISRGIVGRVARTRRAELVEDVLHDPDYIMADRRVTQQACVPIIRDDRLVGLISVEVIDPTLTRADLDLLTTLAGEVTETMRNAGLFAEVRQARDELRALYESAQGLSKSLELTTILDGLVSGTCRRFGYRCGAILLPDPGGDLVVRAVHGDSWALGQRAPLGQGAEGRAAQEARAVLLAHPEPAAPETPQHGPALAVPLMREDTVVGVFSVSVDQPGVLGERDTRILTTLAGYAAVAIENATLYERTRDLASTDGLTGLLNHRAFWQALTGELERAKRYALPLSLIVIEIDRFKRYNDRYGHLRGDEVLRLVARALVKEHRKQIDTAARYGGDEFTLLLPHTDKAGAAAVAERIRLTIEATPFIVGAEITSVSVSLGIAGYPEDAETADALLDAADRRMYVAKHSGGNAVAPLTP
jgi:diguanylate cyclase (GGDEF)-like protein